MDKAQSAQLAALSLGANACALTVESTNTVTGISTSMRVVDSGLTTRRIRVSPKAVTRRAALLWFAIKEDE